MCVRLALLGSKVSRPVLSGKELYIYPGFINLHAVFAGPAGYGVETGLAVAEFVFLPILGSPLEWGSPCAVSLERTRDLRAQFLHSPGDYFTQTSRSVFCRRKRAKERTGNNYKTST